jgi:hypothetical protein
MGISKGVDVMSISMAYKTVSQGFIFSTGEELWKKERLAVQEIQQERHKPKHFYARREQESQKPRIETYSVDKRTFALVRLWPPQQLKKIDNILENMVQIEITSITIDKISEELHELERKISSGNYQGTSIYPEEIQRLLSIRKLLQSLPKNQTISRLLDKSIEILYNYLSKGGILKREDLKEFIMNVPMDKDLSVILPSLDYPEEMVKAINKAIDETLDKKDWLPPDLKIKLKNEVIMFSVLLDLLRR